MNNPFSVEGKTILITGAASGIGKATALQCVEMGARVILLDLNEEGLNATKAEMPEGSVETYALNMTDFNALCDTVAKLPKLDGVVSNAGIFYSMMAKLSDKKDMERIFEINTFSHINMIQQLMEQKKLNKGASVVFTSSMSGVFCGAVGGSLYGATKSALAGYAKALAIELAPRGIRVNTIHPGMINTPLIHSVALSQDVLDEDKKNYPLGRYGEPEEVAYSIIYLLSDATKWVTGTQLLIDGGFSVK
ncbi:MAG: SDR family oxidoreductase [Prevotella sp.]|nr:SDR family oxidoreductase [Prevotella sp.]